MNMLRGRMVLSPSVQGIGWDHFLQIRNSTRNFAATTPSPSIATVSHWSLEMEIWLLMLRQAVVSSRTCISRVSYPRAWSGNSRNRNRYPWATKYISWFGYNSEWAGRYAWLVLFSRHQINLFWFFFHLTDNIESNISSVAVDTAGAAEELHTASDYQRKAGRRAACLMIVMVIVICVVLLAVRITII